MNGPAGTGGTSLDALAAEIAVRGWVFEIVAMGVSLRTDPIMHMAAGAYIGRIFTPSEEVEMWDETPHAALASALAETVRTHGAAQ